jgi:aspartyl-tRNA(Asn)/glutamyl-tRNA(Gln) amidotransferase subunit A
MQPCRMSAVALLRAYRSRALSPVEAMQDVRTRITLFEPHICPTDPQEPEHAVKEAGSAVSRQTRSTACQFDASAATI